jgi:hypothetical protein
LAHQHGRKLLLDFQGGVIGTYHWVSETHLARYAAELDFRYNHRSGLGFTDRQRADAVMRGIEGKRLTYRRTLKRGRNP